MAYNGSIDLISGIRQKNNGDFPLVDAKDVRVTDQQRLDAALAEKMPAASALPKPEEAGEAWQVLKNGEDGATVWGDVTAEEVKVSDTQNLAEVLAEKADADDVIPKPAVAGTEGQHLEIDANGDPVWLNPGTPTDTQVGDAVDAWLDAHPEATTTVQDGSITRAKLDADLQQKTDEVSELKSAINNIIDTRNLFLGSTLVQNKSYGTSPSGSNTYSYFEVSVTSGTKYYFNSTCRFVSKAGTVLVQNVQPGGNYTVDFTGTLYVTVYNDVSTYGEWAMCVDGVDISEISTYQQITLAPGIMAQETGTSKRKTMSQNAIKEAIATAKSEAEANIVTTVDTIRNDYNLFNGAPLVPNKYYHTKADPSDNYSYFEINVVANTTYRFACKTRYISKAGTVLQQNGQIGGTFTPDYSGVMYVTVYNDTSSTNGKWAMCVSTHDVFACGEYDKYTLSEYIIAQEEGTSKSKVPSQHLLSEIIKKDGFSLSNGFASYADDLSSGGTLTVPATNCKKNNVYSFFAKITSFGSIKIGHGKTVYESSYITIDGTNLTVTNYITSASSQTYAHGLTISDYIYVTITVENGTATVNIFSNGNEFEQEGVTWFGDGSADYFAECVSGTLTECKLTWGSADFRKRLWAFGDSYFSFTNEARWTHYLIENGYIDNVLLSGFPGENSTDSTTALNGAVQYGTPKMIIWALGMNDGSDDGAYTTRWKTGIDNLIAYCEANYIEPILCTVPTVPSVNNEYKNAYVRASGHRYIDFAKAVGADSSGVWFAGMLSGDNVHPTELGAKALYRRAIMDCPELTFNND